MGRAAWLQVLKGTAKILGESLVAGDGISVEDAPSIEIHTDDGAELLWFDLA